MVLTSVLTLHPITEASPTQTGHGEVHIVVQELAPLHQHVGVVFVQGDFISGHDSLGHLPGAGLGEAVVEVGRVPAHRGIEAILIDGFEEPPEGGEGCPPLRV